MLRRPGRLPLVFTLAGAALGISWAMLYRQEPKERAHVHLDDSMPALVGGAAVGFIIGWAVSGLCRWRPGLRPAVEVLAVALLCGSVAAPIGWIVGDSREVREPRRGMLWGAGAGIAVGLGAGLVQWRADRRRAVPSSGGHNRA
jgi:hypothetical protein